MVAGDGVYKSTDAGKTWKHLGLADTQMIGKIVIDPANCDRVYVAALGHLFGSNTERGVFRSTDGGTTWHKVLYVNSQTGSVDMSMDPSNPNVLYASMWHVYRQPWLLSDGGTQTGQQQRPHPAARLLLQQGVRRHHQPEPGLRHQCVVPAV
jgi:photosystem II stability/assembly factor-like uncharacterized protein